MTAGTDAGQMAAFPGPVHDGDRSPSDPPTAVCVVTMRVEVGRLLVSVLVNPDVRTRATERRYRPVDLDEALRLIRDAAHRLLA